MDDLGGDIARTDARRLLAQKLEITVRTLSRWLTRDFQLDFETAIRKAQRQNSGQKNRN